MADKRGFLGEFFGLGKGRRIR